MTKLANVLYLIDDPKELNTKDKVYNKYVNDLKKDTKASAEGAVINTINKTISLYEEDKTKSCNLGIVDGKSFSFLLKKYIFELPGFNIDPTVVAVVTTSRAAKGETIYSDTYYKNKSSIFNDLKNIPLTLSTMSNFENIFKLLSKDWVDINKENLTSSNFMYIKDVRLLPIAGEGDQFRDNTKFNVLLVSVPSYDVLEKSGAKVTTEKYIESVIHTEIDILSKLNIKNYMLYLYDIKILRKNPSYTRKVWQHTLTETDFNSRFNNPILMSNDVSECKYFHLS
jgi:hypothetical protein